MLAFVADEDHFEPLSYIQPKLDGLRALYQNGQFVSRDGKTWESNILSHIRNELVATIPPDLVLDGELYAHGLYLQEINARAGVKRTIPHVDEKSIHYHVFDIIADETFYTRYIQKTKSYPFQNLQYVRLVPTHIVSTWDQSTSLFAAYKAKGYEGIMYRTPHDSYALPHNCRRKDNRSWSLQKRKGTLDLIATIVDVCPGSTDSKYAECMGELLLRHPDVHIPFKVGSGFSDAERKFYWEHRELLIGSTCHIEFDEYSKNGVPLRLRSKAVFPNTELANLLV